MSSGSVRCKVGSSGGESTIRMLCKAELQEASSETILPRLQFQPRQQDVSCAASHEWARMQHNEPSNNKQQYQGIKNEFV